MNAKTEYDKISVYADLLNHLYKNTYNDGNQTRVNITYNHFLGNDVLNNLIKHENTKIPRK